MNNINIVVKHNTIMAQYNKYIQSPSGDVDLITDSVIMAIHHNANGTVSIIMTPECMHDIIDIITTGNITVNASNVVLTTQTSSSNIEQ